MFVLNVLLMDCLFIFSEYPLRPEFQNSVGGKHHQLDATAMEFFPKSYSTDSGNDGSGSSSEDINIESKGMLTLNQHQLLFYALTY